MLIEKQLQKANDSKKVLQQMPEKELKKLLQAISKSILKNESSILQANKKDLSLKAKDDPKNDRLLLNHQRLNNIATAIKNISTLQDPTGVTLTEKTLPNGIRLKKITVPLGVVGAIYESRPNVTFDIAALCLRSRNACVLKGSADADNTNRIAVKIIKTVLKNFGLETGVVTLLPSHREIVQEMLGATKYLDVLIPRGSQGLINYVRKNSAVPIIETGAGVCHIYIEKQANLEKAVSISVNAKVSRPSVCNAADTFIVDEDIMVDFLSRLKPQLSKYGVEIFADKKAYAILGEYPLLHIARKEDFGKEFLSLKCAIKTVKGIDEALQHIDKYSTKHSEAIISEDKKICQRFLQEVDAATVYANASTRFTDGEVFGLGAEIGISTQKLHARGPFALEKLITEKWILEGDGQIRK